MKVPRVGLLNGFTVPKVTKTVYVPNALKIPEPLDKDTVSFTSTAQYLKKYLTLPDEIKLVLSPEDAIDMFKDMEWLAQGRIKIGMVGEGKGIEVYKNPWLDRKSVV